MHAVPVPVPNAAPTPVSMPDSVPELNELEDLLYDLLATADPNVARSALDATQMFLHEHARERKTQRQFVEFFDKHGLPLRPERPNLLALPALDSRGRASEAPVLMPEPQPRFEPLPIALPPAADGGKVALPEPRRRDWPWLLALAAIGCTTALAVAGMLELQGELGRLHAEAAQNASLLEQLRSETVSLRAQVTDANEALQQNQRDTQLLLRAFSSPLNITSR